MLKIIQKIHFSHLEVGKTTSRWIFWRKLKNQNLGFLRKKIQYFSRTSVEAPDFVFLISKVGVVSFFSRLKIFKLSSLSSFKDMWHVVG